MEKMKRILLFLLFSVLFAVSNLYAKEIKFDLNKDKALWITWAESDGTDIEIFCKKYEGSNWSDKIAITNNATLDTSPNIALDHEGNPWVVWSGEDGVSSSIFFSKLVEGNWTDPAMLGDLDAYSDMTPSITFGSDGFARIAWTGFNGVSDEIYYIKENNDGWDSERQINESNQVPDLDPVIVVDKKGQVLVVWSKYTGNEYKQVVSYLTNNTWSEDQLVVSSEASLGEEFSSIINNDDFLQLLWVDLKQQTLTQDLDSLASSSPEKLLFVAETIDLFSAIEPNVLEHCFVSWQDTQKNNQNLRGKHLFFSLNKNVLSSAIAQSSLVKNKEILLAFLKSAGVLMEEAYAAVDTNKFIAFGDSITYGVTGIEGQRSYTGYPALLQAKLGKTVVNRGVSGERTSSGVSRLDSVLAADNAGYILILEGTNDLAERSSETIIFNLGVMIDKSIAHGTTPIISNLIPRTDPYNGKAVEVNGLIQSLAAVKGIEFVDMYSVFDPLDKNVYYGDRRLHPTDEGYEIMATTWYQKIIAILGGGDSGGGGGGCGYIKPNSHNYNDLNLVLLMFVVLMIIIQRIRLVYVKSRIE